MSIQVGIPIFPTMEMSYGHFKFRDNFTGNDEWWGWRKYLGEVSAIGKSGTQAGGKYTLAIANNRNGKWDTANNEAPRYFTGKFSNPCEVITQLVDINGGLPLNDETQAGLFISKSPRGFGSSVSISIVLRRHNANGIHGVAVVTNGYFVQDFVNITTLPVWFRIRVGNDTYQAIACWFDYSHDGVNWTNLHQAFYNTYFTLSPCSIGLVSFNGCGADDSMSDNAILASFESFEMKPMTPD